MIVVSTRAAQLLTTEPYCVEDLAWVLSTAHIESSLMPGTRRQAWSFDLESATTVLLEMILGLQDQWAGGY